jgi:hypothetical protein
VKTKYLLVPFSYIFHPIFISIYGSLLYFIFTNKWQYETEVYFSFLQICILTVLLPICFYILLKSFHLIKSFTEATLEERKIPIFLQILFMYLLLKFSIIQTIFPELYLFFQGGFIAAFLVQLAVFCKFKASLHMIGISSLFAFTVLFSSYLQIPIINSIALLALCMGLVAASRLYMKAHTPLELLIGMFIGVAPQILVWFYKI